MTTSQELQPLVEGWMPAQRWFGGKGRTATFTLAPLTTVPGASPEVTIWTVDVRYDDGSTELYQLPLVEYPQPAENLDHVLLGTVDSGEGPCWVYDALHDKNVTQPWLECVRDEYADDVLRFRRYTDVEALPIGRDSLVLTGEQSNTSLMYADIALLKVFRRLQPGLNPDIEIHAALGERGARHVARLMGSVEATRDGETYSLAMLQEFMTTATDGWELAKTSVRDLMAEADLHAAEAGGDFAGEAARLGAAVAEVHQDLAAAFGTAELSADELAARAGAMLARLEQAVAIVPDLVPLAPGLRKTFEAVADGVSGATVQRIHGDLHLAQALRTVHRWVIIDFEGEPMAELHARRMPDSPLRDVAGMMRSFDYAGHHRVVETGYDPQLSYRATEWALRNREAFCDGYAEAIGIDPRDQAVLLRAYEADKAVYEAVYEARNRPTWLAIPLASLSRLADAAEGTP